MISRLVLDWDFHHRRLAEYVEGSRGSLEVICNDRETVESLRELGVPVRNADPTNVATLIDAELPDQVVTASRDADRTEKLIDAASEAYPERPIVGFLGVEITPGQRARLNEQLDGIVDAGDAIRSTLLNSANTPATVRARRVRHVMMEIDGELAIFAHDNPDPDAIASACALESIAERIGVPTTIYYYGQITHQSNRAFINALDLSPTQLDTEDPIPDVAAIALVDHANPGVNNSLPPDMPIDLIFDHHIPGGPVDARFVDLRESLGATSTILTEYLRQFGIEPTANLATALVYGITTDTSSFSRQVSIPDFEAAAYLWPMADHTALTRIENPGVSRETIETIAHAIDNRRVEEGVLSACVGRVGERDALAQAAELLLQMEGIEISVVYGITDDVVEASARARGHDDRLDLAAIMREAFASIGSAGGHERMAGASIPLGILAETEETGSDVVAIVREVIDGRLYETIDRVPA